MDYTVHGVAKGRTRLSSFHFHFLVFSSALFFRSVPAQMALPELPLGHQCPCSACGAQNSAPMGSDQKSLEPSLPSSQTFISYQCLSAFINRFGTYRL